VEVELIGPWATSAKDFMATSRDIQAFEQRLAGLIAHVQEKKSVWLEMVTDQAPNCANGIDASAYLDNFSEQVMIFLGESNQNPVAIQEFAIAVHRLISELRNAEQEARALWSAQRDSTIREGMIYSNEIAGILAPFKNAVL